MTKKFNRGFTLIELLVVIAIIGILSSVVLASLNTARAKGANAAIKSNLNNTRAQAELIYDAAIPNSYAGVCSDVATIQKAMTAAGSAGGSVGNVILDATAGDTTHVTCHSVLGSWAIEAPLKAAEGTNTMWCVDSTGASGGTVGSTLPGADRACN